jgi:hypothetical protein
MCELKWIDANKQLPQDNDKIGGKTYIVTVNCNTWKEPITMTADWECVVIRNKEVKRWKWYNRLFPEDWTITHWMELPEPYIEK